MLVSILPKYSVASITGYQKGNKLFIENNGIPLLRRNMNKYRKLILMQQIEII